METISHTRPIASCHRPLWLWNFKVVLAIRGETRADDFVLNTDQIEAKIRD